MTPSLFRTTRFWLGVILLLLLLSAAIGAFFMDRGGRTAVITQDGRELFRIDLDKVTERQTLEITGVCRNTIEIEPGRIRVCAADCPDQICVDTGWIEDGTRPIVCLPNRLVIEIQGGHSDADTAAR
ncbi:MAG: NusG domain II-containing protein [Butyricicoccaceae bacterium]